MASRRFAHSWVGREAQKLALLQTRPRTVLAWLLFHLLLGVAVWSALTSKVETQRASIEANLKNATIAMAGSYAEQLARAVSAVDEQTLIVKHYWERSKADVNLRAQWEQGLFGFQKLNGVTIFDRNGKLVASSFPAGLQASMADQPFFRAYRDGGMTGLQVTPLSTGLLSHRPIIRFTRDVRDASGGFDGMISVGCMPRCFASAFAESRLAPHDFLTMRDAAGTIYVNQTRGRIDTDRRFFSQPQTFRGASGFARMEGSAFDDGQVRYVAWNRVDGTSLIAVAATSYEDALHVYYANRSDYRRFALAWSISLAVVFLAGLALYSRLLWRSNEAEKVRRTYRMATEVAGDGFYMLEPIRDARNQVVDFTILDCNEVGARLVDFRPATLIGKTILDLHASPYGNKLIGFFSQVLERGFSEDNFRVPADSRFNVEWIHRKVVATEGGLAVTVHDISAQKAQEKKLREIANTDSLTGLPNRHWLTGYLPEALVEAAGTQRQMALLFIDLDNFKDINDTLGHVAGDGALRAAAQRIQSVMRPQDAVVRLGGDEFTVVLEDIDGAAGAGPIAERIIEELGKPVIIDGHQLPVLHGSIGISLFPDDGTDADALLKYADMAMYVAKMHGKSRFEFYRPDIGRIRVERLHTERDLRQAIERDEFVMHYQPRVNARDGQVMGAEALVRWNHPTRGLVYPREFIPLAEETGLIVELGALIMHRVCAQIAEWTAAGSTLVPISINVSPQQFNRQDVASALIGQLRRLQIPPNLVEIELTESSMVNVMAVGKQFSDLNLHGVRLLVDDFGTGYSSLAQLQLLHLDVLKVDQSLTAKLGHGAQATLFYQAIVAMAHALNMSITAEGVETREQHDILSALACDEIQGFIVAQPLPADAFQAFLRHARVADLPAGPVRPAGE